MGEKVYQPFPLREVFRARLLEIFNTQPGYRYYIGSTDPRVPDGAPAATRINVEVKTIKLYDR